MMSRLAAEAIRKGRSAIIALERGAVPTDRLVLAAISAMAGTAEQHTEGGRRDEAAEAMVQRARLIRTLAGACGGKLSFTVQQTDDAPDRWKFISERVEAASSAIARTRDAVAMALTAVGVATVPAPEPRPANGGAGTGTVHRD